MDWLRISMVASGVLGYRQIRGDAIETQEHPPLFGNRPILDLLLPDQGGEVILRRVRDAGLKTRVAVTTGTDDAEQLREVKALKPEALFEKPVNVADVWREAR